MNGIYILNDNSFDSIYNQATRDEIAGLINLPEQPQVSQQAVRENPSVLEDVDIIMSGWGGPRMDEELLAHAPNLKAIFYGAGTIKGIVSEAFWKRDIVITSAYAANAIPVAEYTIAQIIISLKLGWRFARQIQQNGAYPGKGGVIGAYGSTVGLISLGMIGSIVARMLQSYDVDVIAYDPFASQETADDLQLELCSLEDVFTRSHVVSLHAPWLPETVNMIRGEHFSAMRENATFINTSRGAIVNEDDLIEVFEKRPDLQALLDVTYPEPPEAGSKLYTLENVQLTPHIAGSMSSECHRMGAYALADLKHFLNDEPLDWQITEEAFAKMA